mgnify:CR=1 FL=1
MVPLYLAHSCPLYAYSPKGEYAASITVKCRSSYLKTKASFSRPLEGEFDPCAKSALHHPAALCTSHSCILMPCHCIYKYWPYYSRLRCDCQAFCETKINFYAIRRFILLWLTRAPHNTGAFRVIACSRVERHLANHAAFCVRLTAQRKVWVLQ